jgi:hypothetical protein
VGSAISGVVGEIKDHLPFSPAKKGPLSGAGSPDRSGLSIARMIAQGMGQGLPQVSQMSARMARAAGIGGQGGAAGYGAGAAGGQQHLIIELRASDSQILRGLQATVRTAGGSPQIFTRKVVFK